VPLDLAVTYQYLVGFAYLLIGLFVYFRRGSAQKARTFMSVPVFVRIPLLPLHRGSSTHSTRSSISATWPPA